MTNEEKIDRLIDSMNDYHAEHNTVFYWEDNLKNLTFEHWEQMLFKEEPLEVMFKGNHMSYPSISDKKELFIKHASFSVKKFSKEQQTSFWEDHPDSILKDGAINKPIWMNENIKVALENLLSRKESHPDKNYFKKYFNNVSVVMNIQAFMLNKPKFKEAFFAELVQQKYSDIKWILHRLEKHSKNKIVVDFINQVRQYSSTIKEVDKLQQKVKNTPEKKPKFL